MRVVGLGGSAGGLEAFEQFFASMPAGSGLAFVVVTHLDPDRKALLPELLQRATSIPVRAITDGVQVAPDAIYVIPPNRSLTLAAGRLRLGAAPKRPGPRLPIDGFFRSLAQALGSAAVGVVLSGMGEDGAAGLAAIHAAGGLALVQEPASAGFDAMPRAALAAVPRALVATPDVLPARILERAGGEAAAPPAAADDPAAIGRILAVLRQRTGRDLSLYKSPTIERRIDRRRAVHRLPSVAAYAAHVEANPDEAELLFRELLIGVTHFFRDEEAFTVLRDQVLPARLARRDAPRTLRAWVAGCSSGEEAYSLAIVVQEALAAAGATDVLVQIYATDLDGGAIAAARAGHYSHDVERHVAPARLAAWFTRHDDGYRVRKTIRETVVFAQHDLTADPPFTHLDLLMCRNVLIYLQPVLQQRILPRFHYALDPDGALVLGVSESVSSAEALFTPIDARAKVFRRAGSAPGEPAGLSLVPSAAAGPPVPRARVEATLVEAARQAIVESVAPPTIVINARGDILYASRRTGRYLEPAVGKTNINLFAMARDGLSAPLALAVREAVRRNRRVVRSGIALRGERGRGTVELVVMPMDGPPALHGLLLVAFVDVPPAARARPGAGTKAAGSLALRRELAHSRAELQAIMREVEASHAQVDLTHEELQSTNEELQSTNEELTTSKEELQSLNEELLTVNAELMAKNDQLGTANDDLRNLLDSTKIATLFLDNELRVKRFTSEATRVANLIVGDVGRPLTDVTLRVDYPALAQDIARVLDTLVFHEAQVSGDDGASYAVRIRPYRTTDNVIDGVVITFSDVTALRRAEEALAARAHDSVIAGLLDRWPGMVCVHDLGLGRDVYLNQRARERLRSHRGGAAPFAALFHPDDLDPSVLRRERWTALRDGEVETRDVRLRLADGTYASVRHRASVLARARDGGSLRILHVVEDAPDEKGSMVRG